MFVSLIKAIAATGYLVVHDKMWFAKARRSCVIGFPWGSITQLEMSPIVPFDPFHCFPSLCRLFLRRC